MFTPEAIINSVETANKQFVNTFVTNEVMKKEINKLVDAQTAFAKSVVKGYTDLAISSQDMVQKYLFPKKA